MFEVVRADFVSALCNGGKRVHSRSILKRRLSLVKKAAAGEGLSVEGRLFSGPTRQPHARPSRNTVRRLPKTLPFSHRTFRAACPSKQSWTLNCHNDMHEF